MRSGVTAQGNRERVNTDSRKQWEILYLTDINWSVWFRPQMGSYQLRNPTFTPFHVQPLPLYFLIFFSSWRRNHAAPLNLSFSSLNLSLPSVVCDHFCSYPMWPSKLESDQKTLKQPQSRQIFNYVKLGICMCVLVWWLRTAINWKVAEERSKVLLSTLAVHSILKCSPYIYFFI